MTHTIELKLAGNNWMARPNDDEYRAMFHDEWVPTMYLIGTPATEVIARLQELNPDSEIVLITQ
jgi:hypothetical protein